jgi:hypothetical protein
MKSPAIMTAGEINRELDRLEMKRSKLTDEFISQGRGNETWSETAQKGDPLAVQAQEVESRLDDLRFEIRRRMGPNHPSRLPKGKFFGPLKGNPVGSYRWW